MKKFIETLLMGDLRSWVIVGIGIVFLLLLRHIWLRLKKATGPLPNILAFIAVVLIIYYWINYPAQAQYYFNLFTDWISDRAKKLWNGA